MTQHLTPKRAKWVAIVVFAVAILVLLGVQTDPSASDAAQLHAFSQVIGAAVLGPLFGILIAWPFTRSSKRPWRVPLGLVIAMVGVGVPTLVRVAEQNNVSEVERALANARSPEQVRQVIEDHPEHPFIRILKIRGQAVRKRREILSDAIERLTYNFGSITATDLYSDAERIHKATSTLANVARKVKEDVPLVFNAEKNMVLSFLSEDLGYDENNRLFEVTAKVVRDDRELTEPYVIAVIENRRRTLAAFADLAKFVAATREKARLQDGRIAYASDRLLRGYRQRAQEYREAVAEAQELKKRKQRIDRKRKEMARSLMADYSS